jgi:8-oxo-dGTP diphosphatase
VVQNDDKVWLLQRSEDDSMGGIFELPSGKVETGEALDVALIREVEEETGLDVVNLREYLGHFDGSIAMDVDERCVVWPGARWVGRTGVI